MRKPAAMLPLLLLGALAVPACGSDGAPATTQNPGAGQSGSGGAAGSAAGASAAGQSGNAGAAGKAAAGAAGTAGTAGAAGGPPGSCKVDPDCAALLPITNPAECAEAKCEAGACVFVARDKDGDKHATKICLSTDPSKIIKLGDDCNDGDPNTFPGAWDGPADGTKPNRCGDGVDQNCSGADGDSVAADGESCACTPGDTSECDDDASGKPLDLPTGPLTGICKRGSKICAVDPNTGGGKFGVCVGGIGRGNELCDNKDNDCNGTVDDVDKVPDAFTWFYDGDLDTRGSSTIKPVQSCFKPTTPPVDCAAAPECAGKTPAECCPPERWKTGNVAADDCDDFNIAVSPLAVEKCNDKIDNNCNGSTDEPESADAILFYWDGDHDSFASSAYAPVKACSQQTPQAPPDECPDCNGGSGVECVNTVSNTKGPCWKAGLPPSDCNDIDAARYPGAVDKCDGTDFDCDGSPNTGCGCVNGPDEACGSVDTCNAGTRKCEGGKYTACTGGPATAPHAYCADVDVDLYCDLSKCETVCDSKKKPGYRLREGCYGIKEGRTDCDEKSAKASSINPGAVELCGDNVDNDCDGTIDEDGASGAKLFFLDADGDNYGDKTVAPRNSCKSPGTGWKENIPNTDCRDNGAGPPPASQVNPGAKDLCDGLDRDCNGTPNTGCSCTNGQTQACGSASTCNAGTITCVNGAWSQCAQPSAQREFCPDKDNDGYCVLTGCAFYCTNGVAPGVPSGYRERTSCVGIVSDCNDTNQLARPGGPNEATAAAGALYCDGLDNDCNGQVDDGNACKDQVCFPAGSDLKAWPAGHLPNAGDQDTAGAGPRMTISWEYAPQADGTLGFTKGKVDSWETAADGSHGDGTRGTATDLRVRKASSKSGKLVASIWGQSPNVSTIGGCTYRDTSTAQDLPSCPGISAVCYGDTQDSDVCQGNECTVAAFGDYSGCILTPTCVDVRVKP